MFIFVLQFHSTLFSKHATGTVASMVFLKVPVSYLSNQKHQTLVRTE